MNGTVHRHVANMVAAVPFFVASVKFSRYLVLFNVSNRLSRCFKVIVRRQKLPKIQFFNLLIILFFIFCILHNTNYTQLKRRKFKGKTSILSLWIDKLLNVFPHAHNAA